PGSSAYDVSFSLAGVEGLHGPTKYNGLAESGAVLDPYIICKSLGDCPTRHAERRSFGTRGSQVQILPLRPAFPTSEAVRGTIWGTKRSPREHPLCFFKHAANSLKPGHAAYAADVRFTPKSGHRNSLAGCLLCAKSGRSGRFRILSIMS